LLYCGGLDAARYNAVRTLEEGKCLMLLPGGASEALYAIPGMGVLSGMYPDMVFSLTWLIWPS
jgi:hypothetical protein